MFMRGEEAECAERLGRALRQAGVKAACTHRLRCRGKQKQVPCRLIVACPPPPSPHCPFAPLPPKSTALFSPALGSFQWRRQSERRGREGVR